MGNRLYRKQVYNKGLMIFSETCYLRTQQLEKGTVEELVTLMVMPSIFDSVAFFSIFIIVKVSWWWSSSVTLAQNEMDQGLIIEALKRLTHCYINYLK